MADLIQLRRDTAANWTSSNPTLASGEVAVETDTNKVKMGDGVTAWNSLTYLATEGPQGASVVSAAFVGNDLVFTLSDSSTVTITDAKVDLKGDIGDAATIAVGDVTTVSASTPASVTNSGTSGAAIFDFEIPRGYDGIGAAIDWVLPVSITGAATLDSSAFGKLHICSGSTYTITLPAVSGNSGKIIGFEMAPTLTGLVTIDGNSTELIDGEQTRVMWAKEVALLRCDGTKWTKVAGKSIPFVGTMSKVSEDQLFGATAFTKITFNASDFGSSLIVNLANSRFVVPRDGKYQISSCLCYNTTNSTAGLVQVYYYLNGAARSVSTGYRAASSVGGSALSIEDNLSATNTVECYGYFTGGSFTTSTLLNTAQKRQYLDISEVPQW